MDHRELWRADGRLVAELRRERGWSRHWLAQVAGVSHHTVAKLERSDAVFPTTLGHIAAALQVPADALLATAEPAPIASHASRRAMDALRDRYALYREVLHGSDPVLFKREFRKGLTRSASWQLAVTRPIPFAGEFHGRASVMRYFETMFSNCQPLQQRVEQLTSIGGRKVFSNGIEVVNIPGVGRGTAAWIHLHEFDRRGRLIHCHASFDLSYLEPLPKGETTASLTARSPRPPS